MKIISIVFDSKYGSNKQMAEAVLESLEKYENLKVNLIRVQDVSQHWKDLSDSDGIIFGCPTLFGSISADFKKFIESSSVFFASQKWKNKYAAGFTCSSAASGDKLSSLLQLFLFASQHGMTWISLGLGNSGSIHDENNPANLNRLGCWMGAIAQIKTNASSSDRVPVSDLRTVQHLGSRMADIIMLSEKNKV